jgi:hypothetical protein
MEVQPCNLRGLSAIGSGSDLAPEWHDELFDRLLAALAKVLSIGSANRLSS